MRGFELMHRSLQNSDAAVQIRLSPPDVSVSFWERSFCFNNFHPARE